MSLKLSRKKEPVAEKAEAPKKTKKRVDMEIDNFKGSIDVEFPIETEDELGSVLMSVLGLEQFNPPTKPTQTKAPAVNEPNFSELHSHAKALEEEFKKAAPEPLLKHAPVQPQRQEGSVARELLLQECARIRTMHQHMAEYNDRPKSDPWKLDDYDDKVKELDSILELLESADDPEIKIVRNVGIRLRPMMVRRAEALYKNRGMMARMFGKRRDE